MAESITIARPYAKAVFEQALASQALPEWEKILQTLSAIAEDPLVSPLLESPLIGSEQLKTLFTQVTQKLQTGLTGDRQTELGNFLTVLINEKRLPVLPQILSRYQSLMSTERGLKKVSVTSAFPLNEHRRKQMTDSIGRYLHSQVEVNFEEDSDLIGGAVIRCGNWVMDGSIKGKLQDLRDNLQE